MGWIAGWPGCLDRTWPRCAHSPLWAQGGGWSSTSERVCVWGTSPCTTGRASPPSPRAQEGEPGPAGHWGIQDQVGTGGPASQSWGCAELGQRARRPSPGPAGVMDEARAPAGPAQVWSRPGGDSRPPPLGGTTARALGFTRGAALRMRGSPSRVFPAGPPRLRTRRSPCSVGGFPGVARAPRSLLPGLRAARRPSRGRPPARPSVSNRGSSLPCSEVRDLPELGGRGGWRRSCLTAGRGGPRPRGARPAARGRGRAQPRLRPRERNPRTRRGQKLFGGASIKAEGAAARYRHLFPPEG